MQFLSDTLKNEIKAFFTRYNIPMDDREMIVEKIEKEIGEKAHSVGEALGRVLDAEKKAILQQTDNYRRQALGAVGKVMQQARGAIKKAYQLGYKDGLEQASSSGPGLLQIALVAALVILAGCFVYREFFAPRGESR